MKLTKSLVTSIIGLSIIVINAQVGDCLPMNLSGINIGGIIIGFVFLLVQSVMDLNRGYIVPMLKYLKKRLPITIFFIIAEFWIGLTLFRSGANTFEAFLTQFLLFVIWVISGFYRTVIEVTPVIFKLSLDKAVNFYKTFSRTRFLYFTLVFVFFLKAILTLGYPVISTLYSLIVLIIISIPFIFYVPKFPSQINWLVTSWLNPNRLRLNIQVLQFIYKNKSVSFEELRNCTQEDKKLKRVLHSMYHQRFLKHTNKKFEFHPFFVWKQDIKFFG